MTAQAAPTSPCIRLCRIDETSGLCIGCLRSLDEIARWAAMTIDQQQAVLDALPARKAAR
ncbi:DUF1289 domain-containing protein [Paracoccus bogoriensis]|uniref:DUF1289 domain-containing protein n=1 Tax=Paracoccus bogoriensis TaxID=242065 RepID=UPI001C66C397|nr:DUF1289 domain-containing protein [Paracoccus bogoriensis]MBW7056003.1 DUF1289 domain-containing protein [Paracoccus bogoriensis]